MSQVCTRDGLLVVGCSRGDCDITALTPTADGPWELTQEFKYLLEQGEDGTATVRNLREQALDSLVAYSQDNDMGY